MSQRLIVIGRVFLLLLAVAGAGTGAWLGLRVGPAGPAGRYACPMHPEVRAAAPGQRCPICRMDLEAVAPAAADAPQAPGPGAPGAAYFDALRRRPFGHDVRAPAWVEGDRGIAALLYREDLSVLAPEVTADFFLATAPETPRTVRLLHGAPAPWDRATARVRFRAAGDPLPPGTVGWVTLRGRRRTLGVVPASALLHDAGGPYVLVPAADGRSLAKRPVEVGKVFGGSAYVLSGLTRERVLARDVFFFDAERRLRGDPPAGGTP